MEKRKAVLILIGVLAFCIGIMFLTSLDAEQIQDETLRYQAMEAYYDERQTGRIAGFYVIDTQTSRVFRSPLQGAVR